MIIGSRGSELALWQANFVLAELKKIKIDAEIKIIKTKGDIEQNLSWDKMEGKGFFTKEIEDALLKKEIDLAVHSHKDLPTESEVNPVRVLNPDRVSLVIAAVSEREDPSELLLINKNAVDEKQKFSLKQNAVVGTSSARRKSQMLAWRSDVGLEDLRGNVPTRIQKLRDKKYDAILIANAGVARLEIDLKEFHSEKLDVHEFIPAPAQGVLALQIRESDKELFDKLQKLNHKEVAETIAVERKILNLFDGGCQLPLGSFCEKEENKNGEIIFKARVAKADSWNQFPKYIYVESKKLEGLAEKAVEKIKNIKPCSVFVSRDENKNDFFKKCLEANGYKVFAQSLIEIKQIPMRKFSKANPSSGGFMKTDWVFFSSKNAVKHFFEQKPDVEGTKFGAVGKTTAEAIRKYGKRADFIGTSDDTRRTGKKFSALVGSKTVLFPQAKASMKTIQSQLPQKENVKEVVVYETIKKMEDVKWQMADVAIFVFTSPSNVDTFFEKYNKNNLPSLWKGSVRKDSRGSPADSFGGVGSKVIAMGDATTNALRKFGIKANKQPASFDDLGLVQAVMSI